MIDDDVEGVSGGSQTPIEKILSLLSDSTETLTMPVDSKPIYLKKRDKIVVHPGITNILLPVNSEPINRTVDETMLFTVKLQDTFPTLSWKDDPLVSSWLSGAPIRDAMKEKFFDEAKKFSEIETDLDRELTISTNERVEAMLQSFGLYLRTCSKKNISRGILVVGSEGLKRKVTEMMTEYSRSAGIDVRVSFEYANQGTVAKPNPMTIARLVKHPAYIKLIAYDFLDMVAYDPESQEDVSLLTVLSVGGREALEKLMPTGVYITPVIMASSCSVASMRGGYMADHLRSNKVFGLVDRSYVHHALPIELEQRLGDKLMSLPYGNPVTSLFKLLIWENIRKDPGTSLEGWEQFCHDVDCSKRSKVRLENVSVPQLTGERFVTGCELRAPIDGIIVKVMTTQESSVKHDYKVYWIDETGSYETAHRSKVTLKFYAIKSAEKLVPWFCTHWTGEDYSVADGIIQRGEASIIAQNCCGTEPRFQRVGKSELDPDWAVSALDLHKELIRTHSGPAKNSKATLMKVLSLHNSKRKAVTIYDDEKMSRVEVSPSAPMGDGLPELVDSVSEMKLTVANRPAAVVFPEGGMKQLRMAKRSLEESCDLVYDTKRVEVYYEEAIEDDGGDEAWFDDPGD